MAAAAAHTENRQRKKLDQVKIPEDHLLFIQTDGLLGKGGFGEAHLADCNGHSAAARRFAMEILS